MKRNYLKVLFSLCLFLCAAGVRAEKMVPNFQTIKKEITAQKSKYYYPKLLSRFMANDTTLTQQEYHLLYYGFTLQEDYNPYRVNPDVTLLNNLMKKHQEDLQSKKICDSILVYTDRMLADCPLNLRAISLKVFAYKCNKQDDLVKVWNYKLHHLLKVIELSGDGRTQSSAYYVINPSHEYELISSLGMKAVNSNLIGNFDCIKVNNQKDYPQGVFFNIKRLLDVYHLKFEETHD